MSTEFQWSPLILLGQKATSYVMYLVYIQSSCSDEGQACVCSLDRWGLLTDASQGRRPPAICVHHFSLGTTAKLTRPSVSSDLVALLWPSPS
jgi:hypothetical protein